LLYNEVHRSSPLSSRWFRFLISSLGCGALFYGAANFCNAQTDGFSVARIHSDLPYNPAWESTSLDPLQQMGLNTALNQTFYYLGCGGQCFAFVSKDGQYVIKFFKHKFRKPFSYFLCTNLPEPFEKKRLKKYHKALCKLNRDFNSYKLAYEELPEETGLLYIHLNKGKTLPSVTIVDKLGIAHKIALSEVEFVVQKRAQLAYSYIEELMDQGDTARARIALRSIVQIIASRCQKGIFDEDARIHRNFGFIDSKPIFIDVGRFTRDPTRKDPVVYIKDIENITVRFRDWLMQTHPELVKTLDEEIHAMQNQI
jgi:glycosyltransferase involved in cell wall biosynthesis